MIDRDLKNVFQKLVTKFRDQRERGTLGRKNADGSYTIKSETRANHVIVKHESGTYVELLNVGKGSVPIRDNLPVMLIRLHNGDLILDGQDDSLLYDDDYPENDYGVRPHTLPSHLDVPSYGGNAGKILAVNSGEDGAEWIPNSGALVSSVNGLTGDVELDTDNVPEGGSGDNLYMTSAEAVKLAGIATGADVTVTAINSASENTTPLTTDRIGVVVSGVLKWIGYGTVRDTIKSYYDSVVATLTNKSIDASNNTLTNINTSALANQAVSFGKMQNVTGPMLAGRVTADTGSMSSQTISAFFASLITAASASAFRALVGSVGLTGAETIAGAKSFSDLATFSAGALIPIGAYSFSANQVAPSYNYLQIEFTRGATQFGGVTIFVSMIARKAAVYYRGLQIIQVNSSSAAVMPWTATDLAAGITTTATTNTATNLTLKFDLGTTGYTDIAIHCLIVGLKHPNITVNFSTIT